MVGQPRWWCRPRVWEATATGLFTLWVIWPFLRPGRWVTTFDTATYSAPNHEVTATALRDGRLPVWNDAIFGGTPHMANPQTSVFYPLRYPLLWLDTHDALDLLAAAHVALLATGLFVLLAFRLRLRPPAASVGTVAFVGSGVVMVRAVQSEQIAVLAWAPWLLVAVDLLLDRHRRALPAVAGLAVVTGVLLVAGHPQQAYLIAPLAGAWCLARAVDRGSWSRVPAVLAAVVLGCGLAAVQLVPTASTFDEVADRSDLGFDVIAGDSFIAPTNVDGVFLGNPFSRRPDVVAGGFETVAVVGSAVATLAALGAVHGARRRSRRWTVITLGVAGAVATVLAVGPSWAPYRVAFDAVPLFDQARTPGRWLAVAVLAAVVFAAFGVDALARRDLDRRDLLVTGTVLAAMALAVGVATDHSGPRAPWIWMAAAALIAGAVLVRLRGDGRAAALALGVPVVLVAAELGASNIHSFARKHAEPVPVTELGTATSELLSTSGGRILAYPSRQVGNPQQLVRQLRPNANLLEGVRSIDGYDGGLQLTKRWIDLVGELTGEEPDPNRPLFAELDRADPEELAEVGVRWLVVDRTAADPRQVAEGWSAPVMVDGPRETFENPAYTGEAALLPCPDCEAIQVPVARSEPGRLVADLANAPGGELVIAEQAAEGWRATVDGVEAPVSSRDGFRLSVEVPDGAEEAVLSYRAPGLRTGALITLLSLVVVAVLAGIGIRDRRRLAGATATR